MPELNEMRLRQVREQVTIDTPSNLPAAGRPQAVLVTGCPRAGTTWVGQTLASAPDASYLLEPLNLSRAERYFSLPVAHWYQQLNEQSDPRFRTIFADLLSGRTIARCDRIRWRDFTRPLALAKLPLVQLRDRRAARQAAHIILKDPISLLSTEWFVQHFDVRPVVMTRHPAAIVSSMRIMGWSPDFDDLFHQAEVVQRFFPDVQSWLEQHPYRSDQDETLYKGSILWRLLHEVILKYRDEHPEWTYLRHEDISRDPHASFRQLMQQLEIPFTDSTDKFINKTTTRSHPQIAQESKPANDVNRDTRRNIHAWKDRLTPSEIQLIHDLTGDVAAQFYTDDDW